MSGKPIRPADVGELKAENFPAEVFDAFNELIAAEFVGNSATFRQDEVVKLMKSKGLSSRDIFDKGWLNVEAAYTAVGWVVEYDKPAYNEDYPATFTFKKKK